MLTKRKLFITGILIVALPTLLLWKPNKSDDPANFAPPAKQTIKLDTISDPSLGHEIVFDNVTVGERFDESESNEYPGRGNSLTVLKLTLKSDGTFSSLPRTSDMKFMLTDDETASTLTNSAKYGPKTIARIEQAYQCDNAPLDLKIVKSGNQSMAALCVLYVVPNNLADTQVLTYKRPETKILGTDEKIRELSAVRKIKDN